MGSTPTALPTPGTVIDRSVTGIVASRAVPPRGNCRRGISQIPALVDDDVGPHRVQHGGQRRRIGQPGHLLRHRAEEGLLAHDAVEVTDGQAVSLPHEGQRARPGHELFPCPEIGAGQRIPAGRAQAHLDPADRGAEPAEAGHVHRRVVVDPLPGKPFDGGDERRRSLRRRITATDGRPVVSVRMDHGQPVQPWPGSSTQESLGSDTPRNTWSAPNLASTTESA